MSKIVRLVSGLLYSPVPTSAVACDGNESFQFEFSQITNRTMGILLTIFCFIRIFCSSKKILADVYGEDELTVRQCQNWLAKFRFGNSDVENAKVLERQLKLVKT